MNLPHTPLRLTLLLLSAFAIPSSGILHAAPPELILLQQTYDKAVAERVTAPFEAALTTLNTKYSAALDGAATEAKKEGKLPDVIAIEADKTAISSKQTPPDTDDESTPESLKKLRAIYRAQYAKLTDARTTNHNTFLPSYLEKLKTLETTLTKADRVDEAKEIMGYREGVAAGGEAPAAVAATSASAGKPTAPAADDPNLPIGNDRKAAEWVLSIGGHLSMSDRGNKVAVTKAADIPRGATKIVSVSINAEADKLQSFESNDLNCLAGLSELQSVFFNFLNLKVEAEGLKFLSSCPKVSKIHLWYNNIDPAFIDALIPLNNLSDFQFCYGKTGALKLSQLKAKNLKVVAFGFSNLDDSTLVELTNHASLEGVFLDMVPGFTDAGIGALKGLKKLTALGVSGTKITAEGLKALQGVKLKSLAFGSDDPAQYSQVGQLFPTLTSFGLPRFGTVPNSVLMAVAANMPNLQSLNFGDGKLPDAACTGFEGFKKLPSLNLSNTDMTDEAMPAIAKIKGLQTLTIEGTHLSDKGLTIATGMKNLKKLTVSKTEVTDAGISAFKKARPDVTVTHAK